jgi:Ni/Fe-hydrogenase subunit HybB-like protein
MEVHGEVWTLKELFVYPNEYIVWSIQIVMYPYMTGLVAGAFVLSSLYHVFGRTELKRIATFSLVFSFCLLPVAMMPLQLHLQKPLRGMEIFFTPHFTSAIAAFGIVFSLYAVIVASEIWFVNRAFFVEEARRLRGAGGLEGLRGNIYSILTLGARDMGREALQTDHRAARVLAGVGIPVACFLHGYAGFIFGSVKANALWMTPLMPVIFIMSAIVSGIALCMLTYLAVLEIKHFIARRKSPRPWELKASEIREHQMDTVRMTKKYLLSFLVAAISLELLDLIFRGYTAVKSWEILRSVIYELDFSKIFILQYGLGNLVPFVLLLLPRLTLRRTVLALLLVLYGVFMMRWNVVIGGQSFSLTFSGFMHYQLPIIPHDWETFREGLFGALLVAATPFVLLWIINYILPVMPRRGEDASDTKEAR